MPARLVLTLGLSLVPLVLEVTWGAGGAFPGQRLGALVLLPWLALSGLPAGAIRPGGEHGLARWLAFALPPLGLAWGVDARAVGFLTPSLTLAVGLFACALLAASRALAEHGAGARRAQAVAWLVVVPLWAALPLATRWAVTSTGAVAVPSATARAAGPLGWAVGRSSVGAEPLASGDVVGATLVLGASALVLAAAAVGGRGERADARREGA